MFLTRPLTRVQEVLQQAANRGKLDCDLRHNLIDALFWEGLIPDPDPAGDLYRLLVNELRIPQFTDWLAQRLK